MIRLTDNIWIGDSADAMNLGSMRVSAVLNVAQDLRGKGGWPDVEYMQVGLTDGPGNPIYLYTSAVLALTSLLQKHEVLVCCHTGSRSLAVVLMHMNARNRSGWDKLMEVLSERVDQKLPVPHTAHRKAFDKVNWKLLEKLVSEG